MAYTHKICDLSRRGDINAVADLMKAYYSDKVNNPWNSIYRNIEKYGTKHETPGDLRELLILLREAVFGALEILSFSLIQEIHTSDVVDAFTRENDWQQGRGKVRNLCLSIADELIEKGEIRYLLTSSLKREKFGFLVNRIEEAELEEFRKAKPTISRRKMNLSKLEKSILGSKFLREQSIMELKLGEDDPRIESLQEAYELQLVELEFERTTKARVPQDTEQITLNGQPVIVSDDEKASSSRKKKTPEIQTPLTEFMTDQKPSSKKKSSAPRRKKK